MGPAGARGTDGIPGPEGNFCLLIIMYGKYLQLKTVYRSRGYERRKR